MLSNKSYETQEELINELKTIFKKEDIKLTLIKNYRETLEQYMKYSQYKNQENLYNLKIKA